MKEIINGLVYDTDMNRELEYWDNGVAFSSPVFYEESLYQKRDLSYYIFGKGNKDSKYCGKAMITPLKDDEAKQWYESKFNEDVSELAKKGYGYSKIRNV